MNRITKKFKSLKKQNKKALVTFITAGDPSLKETTNLVFTLEKAGVDIIEIGFPFSDPMADGPVIQQASERSLKKGTTLSKVLDVVKTIRKKSDIPILLMGYFNPIFVMGIEAFANQAKQVGVDAVLIVDLPAEEALSLKKILAKNGIELVFLLAPTSTESRIKKASKMGGGFLYYVSMTGITGASLSIGREISDQITKIKNQTSLPVCVGFGIKKPSQAQQISKMAEGVVVGSSLVELISKNQKSKLHSKVFKYVQSLRKSIDS